MSLDRPVMISLIQHFEADFLRKVSLTILNLWIILKNFRPHSTTEPLHFSYYVKYAMSPKSWVYNLQGFSYHSEIWTRGLSNLGKKQLDQQNWEEFKLDRHFK